MIMSFLRPRTAVAMLAVATMALAATTAVAAVVIYSNDMSSESEFDEIARSGGGKRCDKKYREKSKTMHASVKKTPTTCSFRPPVQGDNELPNQGVAIDGKILKKTPKFLRNKAFIEATVRAGGGNTGYTLRIYPKKQRYELKRGPDGGNFPATGHSDAINKINEKNRIEVIATGARIQAVINGEEVAKVNDSNPGQVQGTKIRFAIGSGSQRDTEKTVVGTFKRIAVSVPDP
jgi:hypothetical protein